MINLPGYTINEKIYESENSIIYRGRRDHDGKNVILKMLKEEYPSLEKVSRFHHEYEILKKLSEDVTVAVHALETHKNTFVIVIDEWGIDLQQYLETSKRQLSLLESVALAIRIITCLDKIHRNHIIHKDINCSSWTSSAEFARIITQSTTNDYRQFL